MKTKAFISSELALATALQAFDAQRLLSHIVTDNGIKAITRDDIVGLLDKGYFLRQAEDGQFYFSRGLLGGSPLDELERKLMAKPAEQRSVFITYQWAQKEIAKKLQAAFEAQGYMVIRDEEHLKYNTDLPRFMQIVNNNNVDYVLPIISSSYLKSKNCMFEVSQILRRDRWEKRLLPYVVAVDQAADAKIYGGIGPYVAHWQQALLQEQNPQEKTIIEGILRNIQPFTDSIAKRINIAEADLIKNNYKEFFELINSIEADEHGVRFKEIHELLRKADVNDKQEETDAAKADYESALTKAKSMQHVPGIELILGKVYGLYGAFLLNQDNQTDKALGAKYQRIAGNFGYVLPANPNTSSSSDSSYSSTSVRLNPALQNLYISNSANATTTTAQAPAPKAVNPADVAKLLRLVAEGEQEQAEAMIKAEPALLLHRGEVTDLSKRCFKDITAFQYAVWALDWHMWTMLQKYLPEAEQKAQASQFETGAWVKTHGVMAGKLIQNLVIALKQLRDNLSEWTNEQRDAHWVKKVGGAQLYLPANVINEYCRTDRSFDPTPSFREATLPRTRQTSEGEWFVAAREGGTLGDGWAAGRTIGVYGGYAHALKSIPAGQLWFTHTLTAVNALLAVRTHQLTELLESLGQDVLLDPVVDNSLLRPDVDNSFKRYINSRIPGVMPGDAAPSGASSGVSFPAYSAPSSADAARALSNFSKRYPVSK